MPKTVLRPKTIWIQLLHLNAIQCHQQISRLDLIPADERKPLIVSGGEIHLDFYVLYFGVYS